MERIESWVPFTLFLKENWTTKKEKKKSQKLLGAWG